MTATIDRANAEFWNELCGSNFARERGITDHAPASLRRFDDAYFEFYPYLLPFIQPERFAGRMVLEIGLGYGAVSQRLAECGAKFHGLDIASNPVHMVNERLQRLGKPQTAKVGSARAIPHAEKTFDAVVSIGCLHHTGDLNRCLREVNRVLRPGGSAILMVYNKFSYREWTRRPLTTFRNLLKSRRDRGATLKASARGEYDANGAGQAAPETVLTSKSELGRMLDGFDVVRLEKQNCDPIRIRRWVLIDRPRLFSILGRRMGLDLYVEAIKRKSAAARQAA